MLQPSSIFFGVADAGLQAIASLPALKRLALSHTRFTNAGMAAIGRLATLESLDLNYTPIGNAGWSRADVPPTTSSMRCST